MSGEYILYLQVKNSATKSTRMPAKKAKGCNTKGSWRRDVAMVFATPTLRESRNADIVLVNRETRTCVDVYVVFINLKREYSIFVLSE